jgi:hypothetical protein
MAIAPHTTLPTFATATEMSQYFLQRHNGDLDAAAQDMEALLKSDKELYDAMVDELTRIAVQERRRWSPLRGGHDRRWWKGERAPLPSCPRGPALWARQPAFRTSTASPRAHPAVP